MEQVVRDISAQNCSATTQLKQTEPQHMEKNFVDRKMLLTPRQQLHDVKTSWHRDDVTILERQSLRLHG